MDSKTPRDCIKVLRSKNIIDDKEQVILNKRVKEREDKRVKETKTEQLSLNDLKSYYMDQFHNDNYELRGMSADKWNNKFDEIIEILKNRYPDSYNNFIKQPTLLYFTNLKNDLDKVLISMYVPTGTKDPNMGGRKRKTKREKRKKHYSKFTKKSKKN